jgi:hypothetical protein
MLDIIIEQLKSKRLKREFLEFKLDDVDLMDSPSPQALQYAMERLYILGLISPSAPEWSDEDLFYEGKTDQTPRLSITRLGVLASKMICPALSSIESARMILAGFTHDVSIVDLITIAIYLQLTRDLKPTKESGGGEINWEFIYEKLPIKINNEKAFLQARAVINDQFIEGIFLFESFLATIAYNESDNSQRIERWFNKSRCNVIGMTKYFLVMRDALIEQMLSKRINVFGNEKHALRKYDGYRANVAVRDEVGYLTRAARINEPSAFYARKKQEIEHGILRITPRYFVYNALSLARRPLKGESALRIGVELVSVMDGYVGIDDKFNI